MATEVIWKGNLEEGLARFNGVMHERLTAIMGYTAASMETYARTNAPWKDRTSNARNGLKGEVDIAALHHYAVTLSHSVPYGIWLEVRWAGKYAIIMPTIRQESVKLAAILRSTLFRGL